MSLHEKISALVNKYILSYAMFAVNISSVARKDILNKFDENGHLIASAVLSEDDLLTFFDSALNEVTTLVVYSFLRFQVKHVCLFSLLWLFFNTRHRQTDRQTDRILFVELHFCKC